MISSKRGLRLVSVLAVVSIGMLLGSCRESAPVTNHQKPVASLYSVMTTIIDPAVDPLWESVSQEISAEGEVDHAPRTEEDWQAVRGHALRLIEATNLLLIRGRNVVNAGEAVSDAELEGVYDADEIAKAINANFDAYAAHVVALRSASEQALAAIDRKDIAALEQAGGQIELSCEGCHTAFWYPGAALPEDIKATRSQ